MRRKKPILRNIKKHAEKRQDAEAEYAALSLEKLRNELYQDRMALWLSHKVKPQSDKWII